MDAVSAFTLVIVAIVLLFFFLIIIFVLIYPRGPSTGRACTTNSNCPGNQVCDGPSKTCRVPDGSVCVNDSNCLTGHKCTAGVCVGITIAMAPLNTAIDVCDTTHERQDNTRSPLSFLFSSLDDVQNETKRIIKDLPKKIENKRRTYMSSPISQSLPLLSSISSPFTSESYSSEEQIPTTSSPLLSPISSPLLSPISSPLLSPISSEEQIPTTSSSRSQSPESRSSSIPAIPLIPTPSKFDTIASARMYADIFDVTPQISKQSIPYQLWDIIPSTIVPPSILPVPGNKIVPVSVTYRPPNFNVYSAGTESGDSNYINQQPKIPYKRMNNPW